MDFLRFKGVVFDFDGTLADTLSMWSDIDDMFAKKHNIVFEDDYPDTIAAMNFNQAANYTKEHFNLNMTVEEIIGEWYGYAIYEHTHNIYFKDGAVDFVKFLKQNGIKTAIASASETELIFPALKNNNAENLFDAFAMTKEVKRGKGFPDVYDLACERMGLLPSECVVFEDIVEAVKGAKMGGYKTVAVYDERSKKDREVLRSLADLYIDSFCELLTERI